MLDYEAAVRGPTACTIDFENIMKHAIGRRMPDSAPDRPTGVVKQAVIDDVESYMSAIAGIDIETVRAGRGNGPNRVLAATGERLTVTAGEVGFPMLSRTIIGDGMILVAYIRSTPPGNRWCEIDIEPGVVMAYGPGAEHVGRNLPGLDFVFGITDWQHLIETAEALGVCVKPPSPGQVDLLAPTTKSELVGQALSAFADLAEAGAYPPAAITDDVLAAMAHALSEEHRPRRVGSRRRIDNRKVIHRCIDYANSIQRIPSISELCLVAHVSERRLRDAFTAAYDLPPSRFFRAWALDEAHRRFIHTAAHRATVTDVAFGLGFRHLGRFSGHYKQIYGETPSMTLHGCDRCCQRRPEARPTRRHKSPRVAERSASSARPK